MVFGGTEPPDSAGEGICERRLCEGGHEFQNVAGVFYFFDRGDNDGPAIDLAVDSIRLGIMLSSHMARGFSPVRSLAGEFSRAGEAWKQAGRSFSAITLSSPMRA
jgi:hypothetical protein